MEPFELAIPSEEHTRKAGQKLGREGRINDRKTELCLVRHDDTPGVESLVQTEPYQTSARGSAQQMGQ